MTIWYAIVSVSHRDIVMSDSHRVEPSYRGYTVLSEDSFPLRKSNQHHSAFVGIAGFKKAVGIYLSEYAI